MKRLIFSSIFLCIAGAFLAGCRNGVPPDIYVHGVPVIEFEANRVFTPITRLEDLPPVRDTLNVKGVDNPPTIFPLAGEGDFGDSLIGLGNAGIIGRFPFPQFSVFVVTGKYWYDYTGDMFHFPDSDTIPENTFVWTSMWLMTYRDGLFDTLLVGFPGGDPHDRLWYKIDDGTMGYTLRPLESVDTDGNLRPRGQPSGATVSITPQGQMTIDWDDD